MDVVNADIAGAISVHAVLLTPLTYIPIDDTLESVARNKKAPFAIYCCEWGFFYG